MNKWVLLAITVLMVFGAVQSIRWLLALRKSSTLDLEKAAGYNPFGLSMQQRNDVANGLLLPLGLPGITGVLVVLALVMVALTVRAFLE